MSSFLHCGFRGTSLQLFSYEHLQFLIILYCAVRPTMQMVAMRHSSLAWWRNLTQRRGSVPQLMCSLRSPQVCLWCPSEQFCSVPAPILHGTVACLKSQPLRPPHCPMLGTKPDLTCRPVGKKRAWTPSASLPLTNSLSHPVSSVQEDRLPFSSSAALLGLRLGVTAF